MSRMMKVLPGFEDRRKGALYGQAIGDALGMPYEFDLDPKDIRGLVRMKPDGFEESGMGFEPGAWTDDTQHAVRLALASAAPNDFPLNFARLLKVWFEETKDVGETTARVISHPDFLVNPLIASADVWEGYNRDRPANGGAMRAIGSSLPFPWDWHLTKLMAANGCRVTHFDPRCVASAVAISQAACVLICGGGGIPGAVVLAESEGMGYDLGWSKVIHSDLKELAIGEGHIGHTYKCAGAGFWALRFLHEALNSPLGSHPVGQHFHAIITAVIKEGGDTDTNAAVAGALMGAHIGFSNLPKGLVEALRDKDQLEKVLAAMPPLPEE